MAWLTFNWQPVGFRSYAQTLGDAFDDLWTVGIDPDGGWCVSKNRVHLPNNFATIADAKYWVEMHLAVTENE